VFVKLSALLLMSFERIWHCLIKQITFCVLDIYCIVKTLMLQKLDSTKTAGKLSSLYNNYSMSLSWIWSDKITNERVARVGYNHFISNKGEWNNYCFSKFSNQVLPLIFISTILQSGKFLNLAHYFPYDVKLRLLAHSRSFSANQKAGNAIVAAQNLLNLNILTVPNIYSNIQIYCKKIKEIFCLYWNFQPSSVFQTFNL